jgi:hypothetical protein
MSWNETTMRLFTAFLLITLQRYGGNVHAWSQKSQRRSMKSSLGLWSARTETDKLFRVTDLARQLGPVGSFNSQLAQDELLKLTKASILQQRNAAFVPLTGVHNLLYSAAPGGSSGRIGPFAGTVRQTFVDDKTFINSVELGPLKIELRAERKAKNQNTIQVVFKETIVSLFGKMLVRKETPGRGVWKVLMAKKVNENGSEKLVRIMETPSLFILEQELD